MKRPLLWLIPTLLFGCRSFDPAVFDERLRAATFDTYWEELDAHYPYFPAKAIDWRSVRDRYRPQALAARTRIELYHVLAAMLDELDDWHVRLDLDHAHLEDAGPCTLLPHEFVLVGRDAYLEWLPGPEGTNLLGERAYPRVCAIDGFMTRAPQTVQRLLLGPCGSHVTIELEGEDRRRTSLDLVRPEQPPDNVLRLSFTLFPEHAGRVAYLMVRDLDVDLERLEEFAGELRQYFASFQDAEALILDLQDDNGGRIECVAEVLRHLIEREVVVARTDLPWLGLFTRDTLLMVTPQEPLFRGRLAVLVSAQTASAAEWLARSLQLEQRGVIVGETTAGAEAATKVVTGPDGSQLVYGNQPLKDRTGHGIQGEGVHPDVSMPLTIDQVRRDGYRGATRSMREQRLRKACELLGVDPVPDAIVTAALAIPSASFAFGRPVTSAVRPSR